MINALFPPNELNAAKGDGITNDLSNIQSLINYVYRSGGGLLYFPPTVKGYFIDGTIQYKDNVNLLGLNTLMTFKSTPVSSSCITNIVDNLNNVYIDGFRFETTKDFTHTDAYSTYNVSKLTCIKIKNAKKITLKNIKSNNMDYTLKFDGDGVINELITENLFATNGVNFLHLAKVSRWVANNLDSSLADTSPLNHHYYIKEGVKNANLNYITVNDGKGFVLHFYSTVSDIPENMIENIYINHLTALNVDRAFLINTHVEHLRINNIIITNQKINPVLTIAAKAKDIVIDGFTLKTCSSLFTSTVGEGVADNVIIKNGLIDRMGTLNIIGTVDNIIFENISFTNADWIGSNTDMTFNINGKYQSFIMRNINMKFPTIIKNNASIRISGSGKFKISDIEVHGDAVNLTLGQFIYMPGTTVRDVIVQNCYADIFDTFILGNDSSITIKKFNNIHKGNVVG
ncbi:hypothetical protein ASG99_07650 [Bacillus sp. Soil768D1]|nr:hypothetical protein ASG99_07650 [Bacillus sp. Soil768D1]